MMGLDREAAIEAFSDFLADTTFTVDQIRFVNLIVEHLTDNGVMEARRLYESPFTDHAPHGPDMIFPDEVLDGLILTLDKVRAHALPEATVAWPWADAPREVARGGPRGPDCERGGGPHSRKFCKFLGQRYCCAGTLL
ncbi:MAG: hypothetical protein H0T54_03895 [Geodermatophilaceae bacterium]|nr:hypothetical protein [Geodermatophilaceae bacterium]